MIDITENGQAQRRGETPVIDNDVNDVNDVNDNDDDNDDDDENDDDDDVGGGGERESAVNKSES